MDGFCNYDALAGSIKIEDITSDAENAHVLRQVTDNDPELGWVHLRTRTEREDEGTEGDYYAEGAREAGWLGYYVGKSDRIDTLYMGPLENYDEIVEPFCRGISQNKSIETLDLRQLNGGEIFTLLGPFLKNSPKLMSITLADCNLGTEGCRLFSLALADCTTKTLTHLSLTQCEINEDQFADIAIALSMHPNMEFLGLSRNRIGRKGCMALATLLNWSATKLRELDLDNNAIDDDGMEAFMRALPNSKNLEELNLSGNPTISVRGLRALSTALEHPGCSLKSVYFWGCNIPDESAVVLASGLTTNKTLLALHLDRDAITATGLSAISKMLGDTSSINATFMSNHTLQAIGLHTAMPEHVKRCLMFNRLAGPKRPTISKILYCHMDFDMQPFFEWDFKVLPLAIDWFSKASSLLPALESNIQRRKLSAIYQFIRGMPLLYVESRLRVQLNELESMESKMEEDELKLQQEQMLLDLRRQKLNQRKRAIEERRKSVASRLSG